MIDPFKITDFERTEDNLQEFLLFCIIVAGKKATTQASKLDNFFERVTIVYGVASPFRQIKELLDRKQLRSELMYSGIGQYNRITGAFQQVIKLNPKTCTLEELEAIPGIGKKTSRFFLVHSRLGQQHTILDTHILAYMKKNRLARGIPKATPASNKRYKYLETIFLKHMKKLNIKSVAEFDLKIWAEGAR